MASKIRRFMAFGLLSVCITGFRFGSDAILFGGSSICGEEARRFLRVVPAPIVWLRRARIAVAGGFLHVYELRSVFERRGDESGAHVCRVAAIEPECCGVFAHDAIDRVGIHAGRSLHRLPLCWRRKPA